MCLLNGSELLENLWTFRHPHVSSIRLSTNDELRKGAFHKMSLKLSIQDLSTATLRAAPTLHHHTDRVSEDTCYPIYRYQCLPSPFKREGGEGALSTQQAEQHKANCMFSHSWQEKHISSAKPHMKRHMTILRLLASVMAQLNLCLNNIQPHENYPKPILNLNTDFWKTW